MLKLSWPFRSKIKFHFIHIPKNGGISVRVALEQRRDVSFSRPFHYRYLDVADQVGRELRYFCVVRNPWSRTASRYKFAKQNMENWPRDDPRRLYIANATFANYVRDQKQFPIPQHPGKPWMGPMNSWFNHLEWISDENKRVVCDCLRFEHIDDDISNYFQQIILLPKKNVTSARYDYREIYNDELIEIITETFNDDIDYFGFEFDGPAKRNIAMRM